MHTRRDLTKAFDSAGPQSCSAEYQHHPELLKLLQERERAWLFAAKLVEYWEELDALLHKGLHAREFKSPPG